ncbi:MAG: hypothetical protein QOE89_2364 [Pseudonocardiales bacterium]|nr:hypothetical protein [Pseudonocardiales bacterium]
MIWLRAALVSVLSVLGLAEVSGCTHGDPKPNYSSVTGPPSVTTASSSAAGAPTRSAGPGAPTSVPVDQIPPGRPAKWVPAGVPTVAPYKEPGDVVPMFTLAMFKNNQLGALAAALFYRTARNWAYATMEPSSFLTICDAPKCKSDAKFFNDAMAKDQYVVGARQTQGSASVVIAPKSSDAEWVIQSKVTLADGRLVTTSGSTIRTQRSEAQLLNLYLRWSGKMWRISAEFLAD